MRIAYVTEYFTDGLGYVDNILPREFGRLGHESHLVTSHLSPYYMTRDNVFGESLEAVLRKPPSVEQRDAFVLHRLGVRRLAGRVALRKLGQRLRELQPDAILCRGIANWHVGQIVLHRMRHRCATIASSGLAYSGFPESIRNANWCSIPRLGNYIKRVLPGRVYSQFIDQYVGSTQDCTDLLVDFYGIPRRKTSTIPLGVDTELFHPIRNEEDHRQREQVRQELGIAANEIVCIWTGRLLPEKSAPLLAAAVQELRCDGHPFRALFIGKGSDESVIRSYPDSIMHPFVPWNELPRFYRASDIAVWPRRITTSTLDASACGLPVVMSDEELATERWEGNGLTYEVENKESLKATLLRLSDPDYRKTLGMAGVQKMNQYFSWPAIAQRFVDEFVRLASAGATS